MGLVLTIASTSARNVWSDSSFRLVQCIFSSATKIECAVLIWRSHTPPILLVVGGLLFEKFDSFFNFEDANFPT